MPNTNANSNEKFKSYVGKTLDEAKLFIVDDYPGYSFDICTPENDRFYLEYYGYNSLRILVIDNIIMQIEMG